MKIRAAGAALLIAAAALLGGCSFGVRDAYSMEEYMEALVLPETGSLAQAFGEELCVVEGDSPEDPAVTAEAAAVFDLEGRDVIYSKHSFERLYPASITKVMTALVAIKYGDLTDEVTVTEDAVITESGATLAGIHPGDRLTMEQLLYGLMLPSGNDAGAAIAVHMSGSIEKFADLMNEEARRLGAMDTHFVNPHGLTDPDHYTTAYDMYLILNEAMKNPEFAQFASQKEYTATVTSADGTVRSVTWTNGNGFLAGNFSLPEGVTLEAGKTGHTNAAGFCLVLSETVGDGDELISVVFNAPTYEDLYNGMRTLIEKGL